MRASVAGGIARGTLRVLAFDGARVTLRDRFRNPHSKTLRSSGSIRGRARLCDVHARVREDSPCGVNVRWSTSTLRVHVRRDRSPFVNGPRSSLTVSGERSPERAHQSVNHLRRARFPFRESECSSRHARRERDPISPLLVHLAVSSSTTSSARSARPIPCSLADLTIFELTRPLPTSESLTVSSRMRTATLDHLAVVELAVPRRSPFIDRRRDVRFPVHLAMPRVATGRPPLTDPFEPMSANHLPGSFELLPVLGRFGSSIPPVERSVRRTCSPRRCSRPRLLRSTFATIAGSLSSLTFRLARMLARDRLAASMSMLAAWSHRSGLLHARPALCA